MNQPVEPKLQLNRTQDLAAAMAGEALVMMVDDEELVIELIQAYLDSAGYKRFIFTTEPRKALELMLRERPQVVLLDLGMPGIDGIETARRIRALGDAGSTALVAVTGWGQDEDRQRTAAAGFVAHLVKPVHVNQLSAVLDPLSVG